MKENEVFIGFVYVRSFICSTRCSLPKFMMRLLFCPFYGWGSEGHRLNNLPEAVQSVNDVRGFISRCSILFLEPRVQKGGKRGNERLREREGDLN